MPTKLEDRIIASLPEWLAYDLADKTLREQPDMFAFDDDWVYQLEETA